LQVPEGVELEKGQTKFCKLNKAIYGLKRAPKDWNEKLDDVLKNEGFVKSHADSCLYSKCLKEVRIYVLVYFDDLLFFWETQTRN
jgi:Reverse transcriptase (RNA-dependent DNA polymerase).